MVKCGQNTEIELKENFGRMDIYEEIYDKNKKLIDIAIEKILE